MDAQHHQQTDPPPGYPSGYEHDMALADRRRVLIRPIVPGDAHQLAAAIRTADPDTLRRRFLGGPPRLTPELLHHATVVDYVHRFALVAIDPVTGRGVAIAQYEPVSPGIAEVAVAVTPAWRRAGLATVLILLLAKAAAERGIHTFTGSYLAENRPIDALVHGVDGLDSHVIEHGIAEFSLLLGGQPGDEPANAPAGG